IRDCVGSVAELEAARDVVNDVLNCPLRVEESLAYLDCVEPVGEQPENADFSLRQSCEGQATRIQDLALELANLPEQPSQQIWGQATLVTSGSPEGSGEILGTGLFAAEHSS